jgi:hypothetical protein
MSRWWKIWKYALGSFNDEDTKPVEDQITIIRTVILLLNTVTCCFIIASNIKNLF